MKSEEVNWGKKLFNKELFVGHVVTRLYFIQDAREQNLKIITGRLEEIQKLRRRTASLLNCYEPLN